MAEQLEVKVNLLNEKVLFEGSSGANPPVIIDYKPPLGDGQGYTSLELFLLSLASCSGSTVVSLLRKMKKNINGFEVKAQGLRREVHPTSFQKIFLEYILDSEDTSETDLLKAIHLSSESYCPVWAMIKNNVEITYKVTIEHRQTVSNK